MRPRRRILQTLIGAIAHYAHELYVSCSQGCRLTVLIFVLGLLLLTTLPPR